MDHEHRLPPLADLGTDLLRITPAQRWTTLAVPFASVAAYAAFARAHWWPPAVACLMYLSFATYGSISHDLVHRTLGVPRRVNECFLTAVELLAFRSGHAYRLVHLHHHARFPHDDDLEGAAAKMSFWRTVGEGILFQPKVMVWAIAKHGRTHRLVVIEIVAATVLLVGCFAVWPWTSIPAVYAALMVAGGWAIPLATSYIPHNADGRSALTQTKLFRGRVASVIALEHLYHLEHHLYPMVPHHNWPTLAKRLDPYFRDAGLTPIVLGF